MKLDQWLLVVQVASVLATLVAVGVALWLGRRDRQAADKRADADRLAARQDSQRRFDLELLVRLLIAVEAPFTLNPPDPVAEKRNAMGAERRGLVAALGADRMPVAWEVLGGADLEQLRSMVTGPPLQTGVPGDDVNARYSRASAEIVLELDRLRREATS